MTLTSQRGDGPPPPTPDQVREALAGVLPERSLLDRMLDPAREFMEWLMDKLPSPEVGNPNVPAGGISAVGYAIMGVLVVALIVGIVLVIMRWVRLPKGDDAGDDDGPTVVTEELDDPKVLASEADELIAAGRYREALLVTYRQCVAELVVRNWVPRTRSRTTGELRADVADGLAGVSDTFGVLTAGFEDAWFGAYEVDLAAVEVARTRGDEVTAAAVAAGRAPSRSDDAAPVEVVQL